ncbi:chromate transporter-domain-containing protein [Globomyces pollinis-pini]|nr:chromate transporter-domain-containing protein [Globomyces pollinis-pini]
MADIEQANTNTTTVLQTATQSKNNNGTLKEILYAYGPLSLTAFGGPQAHIAMYQMLFVEQKQWLSDQTFTELFAIAQSLPGPASTQLGYSIALLRGGVIAGLLAFCIWSLPGMLVMVAFAYGISSVGQSIPLPVQYIANGLTASAVGLVALAAYKLSIKILVDPISVILGSLAASCAISIQFPWLFPILMIVGGSTTYIESLLKRYLNSLNTRGQENMVPLSTTSSNVNIVQSETGSDSESVNENPITYGFTYSHNTGLIVLSIWVVGLALAVTIRTILVPTVIQIVGTMYFVGSIIFGGGPVVIPLLQSYVVDGAAWMSNREFLFGLALINALPGPNFNLAAYCGALALRGNWYMFLGGILGNFGMFSPGLLLMTGLIPLWKKYRSLDSVQAIIKGVNATAIGLVVAAVYILAKKSIVPIKGDLEVDFLVNYPIYTSVAVMTYSLAGFCKLQPPLAILGGGIVGIIDYVVTEIFKW